MRCFAAIEIDESLKAKIVSLQKEMTGIDAKLVEKENLHFTLKFMGDIDENVLAEVKYILNNLKHEPFAASIRGVGAFPNPNHARVVWLGCPGLYNLQKIVDDLLSPLFKKEKEINPHLTIARVRFASHVPGFIEKHKDVEIGSFLVNKIKLKKSTLTPRGPIYEDVAVFELD